MLRELATQHLVLLNHLSEMMDHLAIKPKVLALMREEYRKHRYPTRDLIDGEHHQREGCGLSAGDDQIFIVYTDEAAQRHNLVLEVLHWDLLGLYFHPVSDVILFLRNDIYDSAMELRNGGALVDEVRLLAFDGQTDFFPEGLLKIEDMGVVVRQDFLNSFVGHLGIGEVLDFVHFFQTIIERTQFHKLLACDFKHSRFDEPIYFLYL
jgi:hypothetical protein